MPEPNVDPSRRAAALACALVSGLLMLAAPALSAQPAPPVQESDDDGRGAEAAPSRQRFPAEVQVLRDLPYGSDRLQRLDVYLPSGRDRDAGRDAERERARDGAPVIVLVHGGAWRGGDKAAAALIDLKVLRWVRRGFVVVSVNHRLLPQADVLTQAADVARALAFAQGMAGRWGAQASRFILMGHSSGAHLVDLLGADPALARAQGARPWLGNVSLDSAALDVVSLMQGPHLRLHDAAFGDDPAGWRRLSPLQRLNGRPVPMLLVCSTLRAESCAAARSFAERAQALGGRIVVREEPLPHARIDADLGLPGDYTDAVEAFMASLDAQVRLRLRP